MEVKNRLSRIRMFMFEKQLSAIVITDPDNQFYFSGFKARNYSRPIHLIIGKSKTALIAPGLEEVSAKSDAKVDQVIVYYEHPEKSDLEKDDINCLLNYLSSLNIGKKRIGIEFAYASIKLEYNLKRYGWEIIDTSDQIVTQRSIKEDQELDMIREAGRLVSFAVGKSLGSIYEGITEIEIDSKGNSSLFKEVSSVHPNATAGLRVMSPSGITRSERPHVFSNTRRIKNGDVIIHTRQVEINGYRAECERTLFFGKGYTVEQEKAFSVMVEAQAAAIYAVKSGVPMKDIDWIARKIIQKAGYGENAIHRIGHSIGISPHESPYIRYDEEQQLEEKMVLTIEPGIYIPGLGGFRHSDTVIVTKNGCEIITEYPRGLKDLTFN